MGTDSQRTCTLYLGDVPIGEISEIPSDSGEPHLHFEATRWTKCRSRKKFIKLIGGAFGIQRNDAERLVRKAMNSGCFSYMDLWADVYTYFVKCALVFMATHDRKEAMRDAK